jgi:hypothetical protein
MEKYQVINFLNERFLKVSIFLNNKKHTRKKAIKIIKNNISSNNFFDVKIIRKRQPFFKGDWRYFKNQRKYFTKIYISVLD